MTQPQVQQRLPDGPYSADELAAREDAIRRAAAAWARHLDGIIANPTAGDDGWARYLEMIAPGEGAQRAAEMARTSGCALVAGRGYLHAVLRDVPAVLTEPYRDRMAVADVEAVARQAGAVRAPPALPRIGDIVHVGPPEHVYIVTNAVETPDGLAVDSIDGGQLSGQWQCIRAKRRILQAHGRTVEDHLVGGITRLVINVYDLGAMLRAYGVADEMAPDP